MSLGDLLRIFEFGHVDRQVLSRFAGLRLFQEAPGKTQMTSRRLDVIWILFDDRAVNRFGRGESSQTRGDSEHVTAFAAFNRPEMPDALWENRVEMKVNAWLRVNSELSYSYDRDYSRRLQRKQTLGVGVSMNLI